MAARKRPPKNKKLVSYDEPILKDLPDGNSVDFGSTTIDRYRFVKTIPSKDDLTARFRDLPFKSCLVAIVKKAGGDSEMLESNASLNAVTELMHVVFNKQESKDATLAEARRQNVEHRKACAVAWREFYSSKARELWRRNGPEAHYAPEKMNEEIEKRWKTEQETRKKLKKDFFKFSPAEATALKLLSPIKTKIDKQRR